MPRDPDKLVPYEGVLASRPWSDPWTHDAGEPPAHQPDFDLLGALLTVPVRRGEVSQTGAFAKGVDAWLAHELRRAGFGADAVGPRAARRRGRPRAVAILRDRLPRRLAEEVAERVAAMPAVTPTDAVILGRAYDKQVDVVISRWDRGPELLVSTKAQVSSFGKNLPNRFEEAYGDAGNLRGRYPLAAVGFLFVQRSTILTEEPDAFERTVDMIRKLRATPEAGGGYTATGLVLVEWDEPRSRTAGSNGTGNLPAAGRGVRVRTDAVPPDVAAGQFLTALVRHVTAVTPVVHHVRVRELFERRNLAVEEADATVGAGPGEDARDAADSSSGPLMIEDPLFEL
ncbi:MAG: hypothetical protein ACQSGP_00470 [Frankia sp.]